MKHMSNQSRKKRLLLLFLVGTGLFALYNVAPTISPILNATHCQDANRIVAVFTRPPAINPYRHAEVVCTDGSGTVYQSLPAELNEALGLAFSPDGRRAAFTIAGSRDPYDIFVMNIDGSGRVQMADNGTAHGLAWSPDGQQLAFVASLDAGFGIYVADLACAEVNMTCKPEVTFLAEGTAPAWSPDGEKIAYAHSKENALEADIWIIDADGSDRVNLTPDEFHDDTPTWSPDGQFIAFRSVREPEGIYMMKQDGSDLTYLTEGWGPVWSPDGHHIALIRYGPAWGWELYANTLYVISIDGTETTQLTHEKYESIDAYDWLP